MGQRTLPPGGQGRSCRRQQQGIADKQFAENLDRGEQREEGGKLIETRNRKRVKKGSERATYLAAESKRVLAIYVHSKIEDCQTIQRREHKKTDRGGDGKHERREKERKGDKNVPHPLSFYRCVFTTTLSGQQADERGGEGRQGAERDGAGRCGVDGAVAAGGRG